MNWTVVLGGFAALVFVLQNLVDPLLGDAIAIAVAFCVFFFVLHKRAIRIVCPHPHCGKYIETNTPWICGFKQCRNERVDDFPFIYRCEHCGAEPKAYQCHHCGQLIFFTKDQQEINYAKCVNISEKVPKHRKKDKTADNIAKEQKDIREREHKIRLGRLDIELKEIEKITNPPKEKTQQELLEESALRFKDRNMSGAEIVQRMKADNAVKFKNDPVELEKQNMLVDRWATDNLDLL